MKKYRVEMFSTGLNAEMNVADYAEAYRIYERMRDSEIYERGHLMDNETGEIYVLFQPKTVIYEWHAPNTPNLS